MTKYTAVEFSGLLVRVRVSDQPFEPADNIVLNPRIPKGVPPHLWRLVDGSITTVSEEQHLEDLAKVLPVSAIEETPSEICTEEAPVAVSEEPHTTLSTELQDVPVVVFTPDYTAECVTAAILAAAILASIVLSNFL